MRGEGIQFYRCHRDADAVLRRYHECNVLVMDEVSQMHLKLFPFACVMSARDECSQRVQYLMVAAMSARSHSKLVSKMLLFVQAAFMMQASEQARERHQDG